jgi:cholesterol 7-dehydrogenase
MSRIDLTQDLLLNNKAVSWASVNGKINQVGPGIVSIVLRTLVGTFVVYETVTPIAPMKQLVRHVMFGPNHFLGRFLAKLMFDGFYRQFSLDFMVHEFRTFLNQPMLVKNDGPVAQYRRWFSQFFPKTTKNTNTLEW